MEIIKLTKDNFEQEVLKSEKPVLVDFNTSCSKLSFVNFIINKR